MNLRDELIAKLKQASLGRIATGIADLSRPSFHLQTTKISDEDISIGTSKLGGLPDLPTDCPWPMLDEKPLSFVGQINLAQLPQPCVAPQEGLLSFF
jgi:uncharacterized protein YwqG